MKSSLFYFDLVKGSNLGEIDYSDMACYEHRSMTERDVHHVSGHRYNMIVI